jgi:hypothetical protein
MNINTVDPYPIRDPFSSDRENDVITAVYVNGTLNRPFDVDVGWSVEIRYPFNNLVRLSENRTFPPSG